MSTRHILGYQNLRRLIAAIVVIAGTSLIGAPTEIKPAVAKDETPSTEAQPGKKGIYVGMPADELRARIGKPDEILPVPRKTDKEGLSEIWVYRRLVRSSIDMVTIGSKPITSKQLKSDGTSVDVVIANDPIQKQRQTQVYKVARFLITDGKYVATTQFEEQKQNFLD